MNVIFSLFAILIIIAAAFLGASVPRLDFLFGVAIPYAAITIFLGGIIYRVVKWSTSPVPFHIPTVAGQQKSLPWIKDSPLESPHNTWGVIGRMALEVLFFRSLFRNTKMEMKNGPKLTYGSSKYLWLGAIVFHWSMLIIILRHLRLFMQPIPAFVLGVDGIDGFFQVGLPGLYVTDVLILSALTFLILRRLTVPRLRYISLSSDYFPLFLIFSIAATGILMRYFFRIDLVNAKELAVGLFSFHPVVPQGIGVLFYVHLFLVSTLLVYFPFSKLLHMPGIFLSPTRNLANNSRMKRHVNPWNHPVRVHTYEEYEDEYREKMKEAGLPLDKE
ncbi:MAG: sulfate reduction electron transfer complex DsrMKJOP subunit DsrM [Bacteroidetes bacterium]|jgi:nitrate reductase gamma subunit|nr:sulfate reduction electron transfer complex DsrMKJOP subunit DsrM [Bacteroidota bacterium]